MTQLNRVIDVQHRLVRSVSLEEDLGNPDVLRGYSVGVHVLDALRRVVSALQDEPRTRAWSITGPYGAGKSSFAHLLYSLVAPNSHPANRAARALVHAADTQLADTLARERRRLGIHASGFISAAVAAEREPVAQTLARALARGAEDYWSGPGRKPQLLHRLRAVAADPALRPDDILTLADELAATAPLLVIVDEFGKNLEYSAHETRDADLYILQQLAERFSSSECFAGGLITMAHLAFEDYLLTASDARRREWRKVHGRFDDVPFVADSAHALELLSEALRLAGTPQQRKLVAKVSTDAEAGLARASSDLALPSSVTGSSNGTYPLHPAAALALPRLASGLGQHDRSLVAFLTSDAPHALPAYLARHELRGREVPFVRLSDLYDYFLQDEVAIDVAGPDGERARETRARVDDATGLNELELRVLKSIAVLNLIPAHERLIASAAFIEEAAVGPAGSPDERQAVRAILDRLFERSLITYREFAGEYRVWQGSDFDTHGQLRAARDRLLLEGTDDARVLDIVGQSRPLRPAVASRHSQRNHVLRYFECRYANEVPPEVLATSADADGVALFVLAGKQAPAKLPAETTDGRPLVVVWSPHARDVHELALDFAAATAVLHGAAELDGDAVARREIRHRVATFQTALNEQIDAAFSQECSGIYWFSTGKRHRAGSPAEFSRLLSDLCDTRYPRTPLISNEMINRRELTSQGAKARRTVLERMFTHEHEARLGIDGYGPERAMYEAVLHHTGLHVQRGREWSFGPPLPATDLADVWSHLNGRLDSALDEHVPVDRIYGQLMAPPFGMKIGVIPVLLAAVLQYRSEDVFLYQDGSFQPVVEPTHIERLIRTPERFTLKRASFVGVRASLFDELRKALGTQDTTPRRALRNATTLSVVRPLIAFAASLPEYTRSTTSTSVLARQIVRALLNAREPDELLFTALPSACELAPFPADPEARDESRITEYVEQLRRGLAELGSTYQRLLDHAGELLHEAFAVAGPRTALREDLRSRSRRLLQQVIEPKMRSFLMISAEEQLDDREWLEAIATTIASKPPASWTDHDLAVFEALVAERSRWFRRLEVLYHEMHSMQGSTIDARRVTLTAPSGVEFAELVSVDPTTRGLVSDVLEQALAELEKRVSAHQASRALLGVLADRVLADAADIPVVVPEEQPTVTEKGRKKA